MTLCFNGLCADTNSSDPKKQPVEDKQLERIKANSPLLTRIIEVRDLVIELRAKKCITDMQMNCIERAEEPVSKLLDVMSCKSSFQFKVFLDILATYQPHVYRLLLRDAGNY